MVGSICSRNCPLCTKSPSRTASRVMRPVMSALTSTFFFGWTLPLAVTAATRSRWPTFSMRTSIPFSRLALALASTSTTIASSPPPPSSTLFRLDMVACILSLTQGPPDRGFEHGQRLVVIVDRCHVIQLGAQRRHLGVEQLEERARTDAVALGRQLQLLTGRGAVRILDRDRRERRLQREIRLAHFRLHAEAARPHRLLKVLVLGPRLRDAHRPRQIRPQRQRDREASLERLPGEVEGVLAVRVA